MREKIPAMLKVNACFSQKVGQLDFGSRGATVSVEVELESDLINQPDRLHERVRHLFRLAKESVDEELKGGNRPGRPGNS